MALDYTKLFSDLGAVIKAVDSLREVSASGSADGVPALRDNLFSTLNTNGTDSTIEGVARLFDGISDTIAARIGTIAGLADQRLLHRETVLDELLSTRTASIDETLAELIKAMAEDGESVQRSTVTVQQFFSGEAGNVGDGKLYVTPILDSSPPSPGMPSQLNYVGRSSQLVVPSETLTLTCTSDSDTDGTPRGQERFLVEGQIGWRNQFDWKKEGSGVSATLSTDNAYGLMSNANWEAWDDDGQPVSWEASSGVPGTDFVPDYDSSHVHGGVASLKIVNNCQFEQSIRSADLIPSRLYRISFWAKAEASTTGQITLEIQSPSGTTTLTAGAVSGVINAAGYKFYTALMMLPANLGDDLKFVLKAETITDPVWVDRMSFAPVRYAAGVGLNLIAGQTDFSRSDRFRVPITNSEGTFQRFFRRRYGVMLPSSLTPTIADSLAE